MSACKILSVAVPDIPGSLWGPMHAEFRCETHGGGTWQGSSTTRCPEGRLQDIEARLEALEKERSL